ncbi:Beta-lactamase-like protein [Penicillium expansum]|uniref:Beta-lactamase-like protein n=1 Tax=Penicillium expansum TaxID=27334 RepID=A0A0A2IFI2_PENEN|nr:Beta-lactamase-like protein [Penicillium expansum]KGO41824.1 Beta-lactamase-like protein [Penicillium expansum]KGO51181.1 Beta-lactamase-like protein [Penicillium expansum]KGO73662.1 Beta-lactamase-like protein [Penicillium expansum]
MAATHGVCDPAFKRVRDLFEQRLASGEEVGASICVNIDGKNVLDIWGGHADAAKTRSWEEDTLGVVFSTAKVVVAVAAMILVDRGLLDVEEKVSKYWPEFAANGKEDTKVWHILSHTSGVPHWDTRIPLETIYDTKTSTDMLAAQAPWYKAGEGSAYQVVCHGHLVGELVRRISGKSLKQFIADEITDPLGADFDLGVAEKDWPRTADIITCAPAPLPPIDPQSVAGKALSNLIMNPEDSQTPGFRGAEVGASNGFSNARALTRIGSIVSLKGTVDGKQYLGSKTIDQMVQERMSGVDQILFFHVRFGLGVALSVPQVVTFIPEGNICFWGGWGGSIVVMDLDRRMTISYTMNKMGLGISGNDNAKAYIEAIYEVMAENKPSASN